MSINKIFNSFGSNALRLFIVLSLILVEVPELYSEKVDSVKFLQGFSLPSNLGWVHKTYLGRSNYPVIIHIQDLHGDFIAQKKISEIVKWLRRPTLPIGLIGLEGAQGAVDLTEIRVIPDREIREALGDYLMRKGWIGGAERAMVSMENALPLFGVENALFYRSNLRELQNLIMLGQENALMTEKRLHRWIDQMSEELKILSKHWLDLEDGKIEMESLLPYLEKLLREKSVTTSNTPHLLALLNIWKRGQAINQDEILQIQDRWIKALGERLPPRKLEELIRKVLLYRAGKIETSAFFGELERLSRQYPVSQKDRNAIRKYLKILKGMKNVEWSKVILDIEKLFREIRQTLEEKDKKFLDLARKTNALKKMLLAQASRKDIQLLEETKSLVSSLGLSKGEESQIHSHFEKAKRFYLLAEARDKIILNNFTNEMESLGAKAGILITGGFHTEGLQSLMEERGFSYVCISPKLEEVDEAAYWKMIRKDRTSFEKSLLTDRYRLALPSLYGALADTDTKKLFQLKKSLVFKVLGLFKVLNIKRILTREIKEDSLPQIKERASKALDNFMREWAMAYREDLKAKFPPQVVRDKIKRFENELARVKFAFEELKIESNQVVIPFLIEGRPERYLFSFGIEDPLKINRQGLMEDEELGGIKVGVSPKASTTRKPIKAVFESLEDRIRVSFREGLRAIPVMGSVPNKIDQLPKFSEIFRLVHLLGTVKTWTAFKKNPLPLLLMAKFVDEKKLMLLKEHFGEEALAEILMEESKVFPWIGALSSMGVQILEKHLNEWRGNLKEFLETAVTGQWSREVESSKTHNPKKKSILRHLPGKRFLSFGTALVVLLTSYVSKADPPPDLRSLLIVPPGQTAQPRGPQEIARELESVREEIRQIDERIRRFQDRRALISSTEGIGSLHQNFQMGSGELSGQIVLAPHLLPSLIRPPGDLLDMRLGVIHGDNPQLGLLPSPFLTLGTTFRRDLNTDYPRFLRLQYSLVKARGNISAFNTLDDRLLSIFSGTGQVSRSFSLLNHPRVGDLYLDLIFSGNAAASVDQDRSWNFLNFQAAQGLQMRWNSPQDRFGFRAAYNLTGDLFPEGLIVPSDVEFSDLSLVLGHSVLAEVSTRSLSGIRIPELAFGFEERFMHRSRRDRFYGYAGIDIGSREPMWLNVDMYRDIPNEPARADVLTIPLLKEQVRGGLMLPIGNVLDWGQGHLYWQAGYSNFVDLPFNEFHTMVGLSLNMAPSRHRTPARVNTTVEYRTGTGLQTDSVRGLVQTGILESGFRNLNYDRLSLSAGELLNDLLSDLNPLIALIILNTPIEDIPGNIPADFVDRETRELIELIINRVLASGVIPGETTVQNLLRPENLRKVLPLFTENILDFVTPIIETEGRELLRDRPLTRNFLIGAFTLLSQGTHYLDLRETILKEIKLKNFISQYTDDEKLINSLTQLGEELILMVSRGFIAQLIIELEEDARRLIRISSATGGQTALEMNQAELGRISRGSRERVRRQMAQQILDSIDREIKDLERDRQRLETQRQRLELEQFRASMQQGGFIQPGLLKTLGIMGVFLMTGGWTSNHGFFGPLLAFVTAAMMLVFLWSRLTQKSTEEKLRLALEEVVEAATALDQDQKNFALSNEFLYRIFGDSLEFPIPQEALGKLDDKIYRQMILRALRENPLGMGYLFFTRDPSLKILGKLELSRSSRFAIRELKEMLDSSNASLFLELPPVHPVPQIKMQQSVEISV